MSWGIDDVDEMLLLLNGSLFVLWSFLIAVNDRYRRCLHRDLSKLLVLTRVEVAQCARKAMRNDIVATDEAVGQRCLPVVNVRADTYVADTLWNQLQLLHFFNPSQSLWLRLSFHH